VFGRSRAIRVEVVGKSDRGRTRDHNEDCFLVADLSRGPVAPGEPPRQHEISDRGSLFVVADGMGGAAAGELASEMATRRIYEHLARTWAADHQRSSQRFASRLKEAVDAANAEINAHARAHPELRGMGTTATTAGVLGEHLYLTQVGDSRAYLIREGLATQLTRDQSLLQKLVESGDMTEEEAARSDRKNIILQALGPDPKVKVVLTHQDLRRGDVLVLCSDGLSGQVRKEEIAQVVTGSPTLHGACERLIALANERGGPDNITVVIARFDGDGLRAAGMNDEVGHQVYPLIDTETSTEPVPVYRGSRPPEPARRSRRRAILLALLAVALAAMWYVTR
jgi:protein phosphatase